MLSAGCAPAGHR